jgi:orotate phosphoribosyltransferase
MSTEFAADRSADLAELLERLRALIQAHSITAAKPGDPDFVLVSGRRSRYYCDTKKVALSPEGSMLIGEVLFRLLDGDVEAVGGLQLGATFLATAVALVSAQHGRPIYGYTVRNEQKAHGTRDNVAESFHPDGRRLLVPGRRVAVVDDVVTEGGSILKAITAVQERQCEIVAAIAIVDRDEGGGDKLRVMGLPYYPLFNAVEPGTLSVNPVLLGRRR